MDTAVIATESQPAIFTVYAWHKLDDGTRELKTHLVAAHTSELAERFMREHQPGLLEGAECFISTDFVLDHLQSFGACHWHSNSITKGDPISDYEFKRWVRSLSIDLVEDGERRPATIRTIHPKMSMSPREALKVLIEHAKGTELHLNAGMCPDSVEGAQVRDLDCKVCQALMVYEAIPEATTAAE
jgi:hypothetical protein